MSNNIEEDIKIVEELLKEYDLLDYRFGQMLNFEQTNAIENILDLIKGKTIHLSDEEYRQVIENAQKEINNRYMFEKTAKEEVEELLENSISKDKVKEKIEELIDTLNNILTDRPASIFPYIFKDNRIDNKCIKCGLIENNTKTCKDCMKQYFREKVENEMS